MSDQLVLVQERPRPSRGRSVEEDCRAYYRRVMADLARVYGVSEVRLRIKGPHMELRGPRGALKATSTLRPAHMPPVTHPTWWHWCAQAALWAHRARACRGCGQRGTVHLDRYGHCTDCAAEARYGLESAQKALELAPAPKGYTSPLKGVKKAKTGRGRAA